MIILFFLYGLNFLYICYIFVYIFGKYNINLLNRGSQSRLYMLKDKTLPNFLSSLS